MHSQSDGAIGALIPTGQLLQLSVHQVRINPGNPRRLFDPGPLADLKENIRTHGVLVPLTVYRLPAQDGYEILDGQRRFQCCQDLELEGHQLSIPANVVEPPTKVAGLLYMFNIHNYRQPWELMPTALSLQTVMRDLGTSDTRRLANLTGLQTKSVERCKILLDFPEKYQLLSLDPDPTTRVPSNFWIEAHPVLILIEHELPTLWATLGREGILDRLVEKYRLGKIRSVIHFRRIIESYEVAQNAREQVRRTLAEYISDPNLETRAAFDPYLAGNQRSEDALRTCAVFIASLAGMNLAHLSDGRTELLTKLQEVQRFVVDLTSQLEGDDPPEKPVSEYPGDSEAGEQQLADSD